MGILVGESHLAQTLEVDCGPKFSADLPPEWIIDCEQVADPNVLKGKSPTCASVEARGGGRVGPKETAIMVATML